MEGNSTTHKVSLQNDRLPNKSLDNNYSGGFVFGALLVGTIHGKWLRERGQTVGGRVERSILVFFFVSRRRTAADETRMKDKQWHNNGYYYMCSRENRRASDVAPIYSITQFTIVFGQFLLKLYMHLLQSIAELTACIVWRYRNGKEAKGVRTTEETAEIEQPLESEGKKVD